ncbi:response regulator [Aquimarina sp. 2201CG5-10]|uniref:tetratricopeptide repeat-containing hybrid sensor histidine kinase/response regulator n=1 Tax=Aquimarina callyspongiae TaxID=3098150 RepID=UPI002AB53FC5|nr:response regulator [Aquimarina sp. 2201CG5-10]MDY8136822.1 response regulator [Aquimarina sp. 2201CG5-10]
MKLLIPQNIIYILTWVFCATNCFLAAQTSNLEKVSSDSIRGLLEKSWIPFSQVSKDGKSQEVHILELAENLAQESTDPYIKIEVNRRMIEFYLSKGDTIQVEKYLKKNLELVTKLDNKRQLGLYYEDVGVHKSMSGHKEEGYVAYIKAEKLLREHGEMEDVIDINYNLSARYLKIKDWNKAIEHALRSLNAVQKTEVKQDRRRNLYLFLAEGYTNLERYEDVENCFAKIKEEESEYANDLYFIAKLFYQKGFYYEKIGDYKQSSSFYNQSSNAFLEYNRQRTREVSTALVLANELNLKEEENRRIKIENELNVEQVRNRGFIILIGIMIILALLLISLFQYKTSSYKTKVNKLLKKNYKKIVAANKKVDKALQAKSEFLDSVTHELLTPLNTIKGTTFLLQKEELSVEQENQIKLINVSSDYLLNLINDVIHLNDLEKGELALQKKEFDLKALINNLIDSSLIMKKEKTKIHRSIDDDIPDKLQGDVLKVSQIFLNILDNALKFTKKGDIHIEVLLLSREENKAKVTFLIKDTGIGMSEKQQNKVFEVFNQGSVKINREFGGTGLGLSIAKKILSLTGNKISLKSEVGKGTSVFYTMDFDLFEGEEKVEAEVNKIVDKPDKEIRILLVEDNKVNQFMTKKILDNYGFNCETSNDGKEAVEMVEKNTYSLILMDIMMPVMDGFEATKYIKSFNADIPVIALTAISEGLHKDKFNEVGIYTVLNKPVNPILLYQTIVNHCPI